MTRSIATAIACIVLLGAGELQGAIFSDNFNGENGGAYQLNYTGFANWTVTAGTVDLIGEGSPWNWFTGYGLYVDMDGSTSAPGTMLSINLDLDPGQYVLSYELAGSQRPGHPAQNWVEATVETGPTLRTVSLAPNAPFAVYEDCFTLAAPTTVQIRFSASGVGDNVGMLLDNVMVDNVKDDVIPEPASVAIWSLIGLSWIGFGAWRRRRNAMARLGGDGGQPTGWSDANRTAIHQIIERGRMR
ncbi:MAG: hypothetical protein JXB62_14920 [Pirellulales bacterium]|nr:hypothetical protein [Pirellulales bacterium]